MYCYFDRKGVLNVVPEDYHDAMTNKWFVREFATHGAALLNIETELEDDQEMNPRGLPYSQTEAYGYAEGAQNEREGEIRAERGGGRGGSQGSYDNRISNVRDFNGGRGGRGRDLRGEQRGGNFIEGTRDRNPNNDR